MFFERVKTPGIANVAYLIGNKGEGTVVNPRPDIEDCLRLARKHKLTINCVVETHHQQDVVMGPVRGSAGFAPVTNGCNKVFGHGVIRLDDGEALRRAVRHQEAHE